MFSDKLLEILDCQKFDTRSNLSGFRIESFSISRLSFEILIDELKAGVGEEIFFA